MKILNTTLIAIAALGVAATANAQLITSAAAFQIAVGNDAGQYLNTFGATTYPANAPFSGGTPTMSYTMQGTSGSLYGSGQFIGANFPTDSVVFTFTTANVRAFGGNFFMTNISDAFVPGTSVTLTYSDGFVDTFTPGAVTDFRGYMAAAPLTSVTMSAGTTTYASIDNVRVSTVPEPATMAALGLGVAAMLRRRKASK